MEKTYKYSVAGHRFCISLPEECSKEECLSPYSPFEVENDDVAPVFSLRVELVESLRSKALGEVKDVLNEEAPYFWLF